MDYSIHDAISAGFNKIIFVIRKDIEADFRERIANRVEAICASLNVEIAYAFQDLSSTHRLHCPEWPHQTLGNRTGRARSKGFDPRTVCCDQCG